MAIFPAFLTVAGCSGINVSKSVSPLDLIPLLQADPPPAHSDPVQPDAGPARLIAQY